MPTRRVARRLALPMRGWHALAGDLLGFAEAGNPPSERHMSEYRTLLVAYDFSAHAEAALYVASDLARRLGAKLHLVHVVHTPSYAYASGTYAGADLPPPMELLKAREAAGEALRELAAGIEGIEEVSAHVVEGARIADAICDTAVQVGADLIVMGTHGRTGLAHVFLGSVAERTLRGARCPVLTVPVAEPEADGSD